MSMKNLDQQPYTGSLTNFRKSSVKGVNCLKCREFWLTTAELVGEEATVAVVVMVAEELRLYAAPLLTSLGRRAS